MRGGLTGGLALLLLLGVPAMAQDTKLVETATDWSVYVHEAEDSKICFVVSQPKDQKPAGVKRGAVYFYISSWPKDEVQNEISIRLGYPIKSDVAVEVAVGNDRFNLFSVGEGAYVENKDNEQKLIDAMRQGATLVVQGRSERGTLTTDEYSLLGVTAALDRAGKECS